MERADFSSPFVRFSNTLIAIQGKKVRLAKTYGLVAYLELTAHRTSLPEILSRFTPFLRLFFANQFGYKWKLRGKVEPPSLRNFSKEGILEPSD